MKLVDLYARFRRYSYPILVAVIALGALAMILAKPIRPGAVLGFGGLLVVLIGLQRLLRPGKQQLASVDDVLRRIGKGRPTLVNFYSNL